MSARRAAASERRRSIELREADQTGDADGVSSDPRCDTVRVSHEDAEEDGRRDILQLIHTVSTFLCSVKEK